MKLHMLMAGIGGALGSLGFTGLAAAQEQYPAPAQQYPAPAQDQYPAPTQQYPGPTQQYPAPAQEQYPAPTQEQYPAPTQEQYPTTTPEQYPAPAQQYPATIHEQYTAPAPEYMAPVRPSVFAPNAPEPHRPNLVTALGMSASLGGSVNGFTGSTARNFTDTGGGWNARLTVGTRSFIGGELAYVGTIQDVQAFGLDGSAQLLSNGGEALARVNLLPGLVQPYIVGGGAYVHYNLVNDDFNTSALEDTDNVFQFPVGAGVAFRYEGLVIDGRGTFRPTVDDEMFGEGAAMESWAANLSGGFEF